MTRARITQSKITKAVKAVAEACGTAQVVIEQDGTIRIGPVDKAPDRTVEYGGKISL